MGYSAFGAGGVSNTTRGIFGGGGNPSNVNNIEYITFETEGNGTDFGDLTVARRMNRGMSNSIRGVFAGGYTPTYLNTMDYVTIATTANATDFGDILATTGSHACCSDAHGGLAR